MVVVGVGLGLPFLLIVALFVFGPWTDRRGWTRTKGRGRAVVGTAFQGFNMAFSPNLNAAVEYQKQCHDEEDGEGRKRRPYFPGISDGTVTIRPLRDTAADLALLAGWLYPLPEAEAARDLTAIRDAYVVNLDEFEVPCIVEVGGAAVGYLQFAQLPEQPGTYRIAPLLGPGCSDATVRPLVAYLYEWEGAAHVVSPGLDTTRTDDCRIHLLYSGHTTPRGMTGR